MSLDLVPRLMLIAGLLVIGAVLHLVMAMLFRRRRRPARLPSTSWVAALSIVSGALTFSLIANPLGAALLAAILGGALLWLIGVALLGATSEAGLLGTLALVIGLGAHGIAVISARVAACAVGGRCSVASARLVDARS